jgi:hypothetical protein
VPGAHDGAIRALLALWNEGVRDYAAVSDYLDPAIELESPFSVLSGEPYRGRAGIERWMREIDEQFAQWSITVDDTRRAGERVIAIGSVSARGRASDVALQFPAASVWRFSSDGRAIGIRIYLDVGEALDSLGLER